MRGTLLGSETMTNIGGYQVVEKIGEGGMASVYKGLQISLQRPVAIKVLSRQLTDHRDLRERFDRESLIIARLNHPNIIHVIDRGITHEGMPYFIMQYVEGTDLAGLIKTARLDINRKLDLTIQICKALSYAHRNGVIHRDIKPGNVLIDNEGNARVLDFGIAQLFYRDNPDVQRTHPDLVLGTLAYMSPEQQVDASQVTAASDLYSLGAVMYELFAGVKLLGLYRPPSEINPAIPKSLEDTIHRCLQPNPIDRFGSADELKDSLLKILQGAHLGTDQRERASRGISAVEDKFALLDVIKEDRYGAVYLYENRVDCKPLVIKKRISMTAGLAEAKLLTALTHENIVNILGASGSEKLFIIVMEYLSGGNLKDRLIRPIPWGDVLKTARAICEALSFAHKNKIVHGNLRPSNILFTDSGEVKVADFGLDEHYTSGEGGNNWYNVGAEMKSPQTDIIAAGTIFYEMLTSSLPDWQEAGFVPHDSFKEIPAGMQQMISKMLRRDQSTRYTSVSQVLDEIDALMTAHGIKPGFWDEPLDSDRFERPTSFMAPSEVGTEEGAELTPSPGEPGKSGPKSLWRAFLLLLLLLIAAVVYLQHKGLFDNTIEAIFDIGAKLAGYLDTLLSG